nr:NADPH:quinone oxidoreductase family protein [Oceanococcus sp. HetDA_MAG_MS8]
MRAIVCEELGPAQNLVMRDLPEEELGPQAVRVNIAACGVNFPDTLIIEGKYQVRPTPPFVPGAEMAGVVTQVGAEVEAWKPGDRVMGVFSHGCYAEQMIAPAQSLIPIPDGMTFEQAAVFPMAYGTSYHALKQRASLQAGETVLVLGAAGGVGLAAVELSRAMGAGRIIAAVGSASKEERVREAGADEVIIYTQSSLKAEVKRLTGGQGVDVIYDPVGGDVFAEAVSCLAWGGRLLIVGFAAGSIPQLAMNKLLLKGAAAVGVFWGAFAMREPAANAQNFAELAQLWADGHLRPHIYQRYSLANVPQALQALGERQVQGKLLIEVADV